MFGLIAILEDSGYMPRMAFIMDRVLHRFGLHGQSVLPMILEAFLWADVRYRRLCRARYPR
jgi:Fe2+ transport system protein B